MNIICCSGGNDSVALIVWAIKKKLKNVYIIFNDTGWASESWKYRMAEIEFFCMQHDFKYIVTESEGFEAMVRRKKGFPMPASKMQFCSSILKTQPTLKWLQENDHKKRAVIYIGVRREESQNRANHPYEIIGHEKYEGRLQKFPLVEYTEKDRDFLIDETDIDILMHGSMECFPCINSNRSDLRLLAKDKKRVDMIAELEKDMGYTSKNKPRVMFRPYRHMGATGVKEVVKWALCDRGKYNK